MYFVTGLDGTLTEAYCFGLFLSLARARMVVEDNATDLTDGGAYSYVVIEEIPPGLYRYGGPKWWYVYDEAAGRFVPCAPPAAVAAATLHALSGHVHVIPPPAL